MHLCQLKKSKKWSFGRQQGIIQGCFLPGKVTPLHFILSDVLKLCKLLCARNVKREATLTQTASVFSIVTKETEVIMSRLP